MSYTFGFYLKIGMYPPQYFYAFLIKDLLLFYTSLQSRETEDRELLKDPSMMKRLNDIAKFPEQDKHCILYALDAMINSVKLKAI
jgi:hypothetical protein